MSIRTYEGEVVSVTLSVEGNKAYINLDLGFRLWRVMPFDTGWSGASLRPRDRVLVDVEMYKQDRERTYVARNIRPNLRPRHPQPPTLIQQRLALRTALTLQERSTYE